jgi:cytochrome c-type biogenesis protein CcmF
LWYGQNEIKPFIRKILIATGISIVLTVLIALGDNVTGAARIVLLFSILLASVVSVDFVIHYLKKTSNVGAAFTHLGFTLFLLGVVLAFSNSQVISRNTSGMDLGGETENKENLVLMKGVGQPMGRYLVTYSDSQTKGRETFYKVDFVKMKDAGTGKIDFSLYPSLNVNTRMGNVYNPDTKHFLDKDIYTFLSFAQQGVENADSTGYSKSGEQPMNMKDTVVIGRSFVILDDIITSMQNDDVNNAGITAKFKVFSMQEGELETEIRYEITNGALIRTDATIEPLNFKLRFEGVATDSKAIHVGIYEKKQDYIVMKAIVFPYIAVLWLGIVILFSGLTYSIMRRTIGKYKEAASKQ